MVLPVCPSSCVLSKACPKAAAKAKRTAECPEIWSRRRRYLLDLVGCVSSVDACTSTDRSHCFPDRPGPHDLDR